MIHLLYLIAGFTFPVVTVITFQIIWLQVTRRNAA
jgi:hypothetical protein